MAAAQRIIVSTALSELDAAAVKRAADALRSTPSNLLRQLLLEAGVIAPDPRRKSRPLDLSLVPPLPDVYEVDPAATR